MASGPSKSEQRTEHDRGVGRIRERTIVIGDTLIAIDNIGSIQILDVKRNWTLARWGAVIAIAGAAAIAIPGNFYSSSSSPGPIVGIILIALGFVLIIANWLRPLRKGLAIGTGDGRLSYVVSEDHAFLNRLLEFLTLKINTRNEGLTAGFDITNTTINTNGGGLVIGSDGVASVTVTNTSQLSPAPAESPAAPVPAIDPDEALFADDPLPAPAPPPLKPRVEPLKPVRAVPAIRTGPHDPLLDGAEIGANGEDDRDWLSSPGRIGYSAEPEGGGARWLLPLVLLLLVSGGAVAGWYFYSQSQTSTSVSLIPATTEAPLAGAAEPASAIPSEAAPAAALIEDSPVIPAESPTVSPVVSPAAAPAIVELPVATEDAPAAAPQTTAFTPAELVVARASGLRYRARPSSAEDVPIIAETRAGGEALLVNGISTQPDGEWYRVVLPDSRPAWFKASLTVPRSRFAETFSTYAPAQALTFAATNPRILEPAEGVQLSGGPQPVRLAWQGPAGASVFVVEIEAYDATARRWIESPPHKRITVDAGEELAELIPRTGAWRWRVRGVSTGGEQTQFSRWAAFGVRD